MQEERRWGNGDVGGKETVYLVGDGWSFWQGGNTSVQCLLQAGERERFGCLGTDKLGISAGEVAFALLSCDPVNTDGLSDHGRNWEEAEESSRALCPDKAFLLRAGQT